MTACTGDPPTPAPPPTPTAAAHPPAPRTPDRDEDAVLDTLASINPCSLIDEPAGGERRQRRPHLCMTRAADDMSVDVVFVQRTDRRTRYTLPAKAIGGAKVDAIRGDDDGCRGEIPVSFNYAVQIHASPPDPRPGTCEVVESTATKVIARLADPAKGRHPADRPDLSKGACDVLTGVLTELGDAPTRTNGKLDLDECYVQTPKVGQLNLDLGIEHAPEGEKWATIGGKDVYRSADGCDWTWSEGDYAGEDDRVVRVGSYGCKPSTVPPELATGLVTALIKRLDEPQSPVKVPKLTYGATEAGEPAPGACVNYAQDSCEPYQPTPIPVGAGPATQQAHIDPHATCTAAVDAVRGAYPDLLPVVDPVREACSFVRPAHDVQLDFTVQRSLDTLGTVTKKQTINLGGHPGEYREYRDTDAIPPTASICVDSGLRADSPQSELSWCVVATYRAPRNNPTAKPNLEDAVRLTPIMAAVVTKYLGE